MQPAAVRPTMTARFSIRAARLESRDDRHGRALGKRRGVRHRDAQRELGREVDVREAGHAEAAEEASSSRGTPR